MALSSCHALLPLLFRSCAPQCFFVRHLHFTVVDHRYGWRDPVGNGEQVTYDKNAIEQPFAGLSVNPMVPRRLPATSCDVRVNSYDS